MVQFLITVITFLEDTYSLKLCTLLPVLASNDNVCLCVNGLPVVLLCFASFVSVPCVLWELNTTEVSFCFICCDLREEELQMYNQEPIRGAHELLV